MESRDNAKFPCPVIAYRLDWDDGEFYVGSTTYKKLYTRIRKHRENSRQGQTGKHLDKIRKMGADSFTWTELGRKIVESRTKQGEYEEEFRELLQPTLNTIRAYLSPEQKKLDYKTWRENNRDHLREYNRKYREDPEHKEKARLVSQAWHYDPENNEAILKHRDTYREKRQTDAGKAKVATYNNKPAVKKRNAIGNKERRAKAIADKLYACEPCSLYAGTKADLKGHLKSKRHAINMKIYNGEQLTPLELKNLKRREKRNASKVS